MGRLNDAVRFLFIFDFAIGACTGVHVNPLQFLKERKKGDVLMLTQVKYSRINNLISCLSWGRFWASSKILTNSLRTTKKRVLDSCFRHFQAHEFTFIRIVTHGTQWLASMFYSRLTAVDMSFTICVIISFTLSQSDYSVFRENFAWMLWHLNAM